MKETPFLFSKRSRVYQSIHFFATQPSGVVASVLSLCAPSCLAAGSAHAASRTRGQTSRTTLSAANAGNGCWQNQATMDSQGAALMPPAAGLCLSATQARGVLPPVTRRWVKEPAAALEWSLTPG